MKIIRIIVTAIILFFCFIIYKAGDRKRRQEAEIKEMVNEYNSSVVKDSIIINGKKYENRSKDYQ